jgi:hypothetical protein
VKIHFLNDHPLSAKAQALAEFDRDSIRQIVAAKHSAAPNIWLANPDQYELNGRLLRDSNSPRLLAYSAKDRVIYATDGCNSCEHRLDVDLAKLDSDSIRKVAEASNIGVDLLEGLKTIL